MQLLRTYLDHGSIRFRLFRLVVGIAAATLFVSMAGGALFEWNNQQRQVRQSLANTAQAAGIAASAAVAFRDASAASEALRTLLARKEIEAAALYTLEGARLASYGDDGLLPASAEGVQEHPPGFSLFSPSTTLFQPIRLDDSTIGHVFIRASLRDARLSFLLQAALAIGVNLLGLLLVLWLGLRFLDRIVKPVKELADTSRLVRQDKNFALRATPSAASSVGDEIGELVDSFNAMLAEIERREHDLASYQNSLEGMVQERTEALITANLELQAAKEAAEAATVAKSRFLAAASHDLRQPIQAINLFQNALNQTGLNEEQKRISDYLLLSAQSLADLLNALLDISKLDAGATRAMPRFIGTQDLLRNIDAAFSPMASAKGLRFMLHVTRGEVSLFTDGELLKSLLWNLIGNALKYTERGGVVVAIRRRGEQALVQVWDSGIGIAPEHVATIFDEYFQVGNPERDNAKGLGLGLSIAQRQARLLATEIVCRSRPGKGSVFEFRLPLVDKPMKERRVRQQAVLAPATSGLAGRRIAVIDDNAMVAKAMQLSLESLGMQVTLYGCAEEALADAAIVSADFYICDFRLPGANGAEFLDAIRQLASRPIKAVLMTGETITERGEVAQSATWQTLTKPVHLPTLLSAIAGSPMSAAG